MSLNSLYGPMRSTLGARHLSARSVQICDAPAKIPETTEAIIAEALSNRLAPGDGELPIKAILAALPKEATISVGVPMAKIASNEERAQFVFDKTMAWLGR